MQPPPRPILLIGSLIGLFLGPPWGSLQPVRAQSPPSLTALLKDCTDHANAGDNPAAFTAVLNLAEALGKAPLAEVKEVLPAIMQAVDDKNPAVRTDQTPDCLTSSIDAIAHAQVQNETINTAVVHHLDAPSPTVRTAVIRDLPELQLPEELFTSTQAHLRQIAASD